MFCYEYYRKTRRLEDIKENKRASLIVELDTEEWSSNKQTK